MSREIKFRAWDKENKTMYPNEELTIDLRYGDVEIVDKDSAKKEYGETVYDLIELTVNDLIEYIGLKDKDNKEIYEGDLLSIYCCDTCKQDNILEVRFIKGAFMLRNIKDEDNEFSFKHYKDLSKLKVIGNIYENPELLENTK